MRRLKRLVLVLSGAGLVLTVGLMLTQPTAPKMAKADSSQQGDMATWHMVRQQVERTIHGHHHHHPCHHQDWQEQGSDDGQYGDQSEPQSEPTVTVTETQQAAQPVNTAQPEATQAATVPVSTPTATPSPSASSLWLVPCTQVGATTTGPDGKTYTCIHSTKYNDTTWHD